MFRSYRIFRSIRSISHSVQRFSPRAITKVDEDSSNVVFNDYSLVKTKTKIESRPVPKSVPKLVDVQTGLNEFLSTCDDRSLLTTVERKSKLFDDRLTATFVETLKKLGIKRDSKHENHQKLFDFLDYFVLKHGNQFDFDQVLTMFHQLASINGQATLNHPSGSYAIKALIQLLKHHVNKYNLEDTGRILITLERDFLCEIENDEKIRPLFDALLLLTKFRENELDRLESQSLAELAFIFSKQLDHVYFTNILNEYIDDEYYHDKYSTLLILEALVRRSYRHQRTIEVCLHFVHENKELFQNEMDRIKECLERLEYNSIDF